MKSSFVQLKIINYILVACASATCFCNRRWWASSKRSCRLAANGPARALRSITLCFNRIFSRFGSDADGWMSDCVIGFVDWVYVSKMGESRNGNEIDNNANFRSFFIIFDLKQKKKEGNFFSDNNKRCHVCVSWKDFESLHNSSLFFIFINIESKRKPKTFSYSTRATTRTEIKVNQIFLLSHKNRKKRFVNFACDT